MRRRQFITLLGGAATWPLVARAQQPERRVGALMGFSESDREGQTFIAAFRERLHNLGWTEGRNIRFDTRWAALDAELVQRYAKELVAQKPDLILSHVTPTTVALLQQTRTIPIMFVWVSDPVGSGFVASLARPGGNATGFTPLVGSRGGYWTRNCSTAHQWPQPSAKRKPQHIRVARIATIALRVNTAARADTA